MIDHVRVVPVRSSSHIMALSQWLPPGMRLEELETSAKSVSRATTGTREEQSALDVSTHERTEDCRSNSRVP